MTSPVGPEGQYDLSCWVRGRNKVSVCLKPNVALWTLPLVSLSLSFFLSLPFSFPLPISLSFSLSLSLCLYVSLSLSLPPSLSLSHTLCHLLGATVSLEFR